MKFLGGVQGQTKNGLKDDPRKGFLAKHLVFGRPGNF